MGTWRWFCWLMWLARVGLIHPQGGRGGGGLQVGLESAHHGRVVLHSFVWHVCIYMTGMYHTKPGWCNMYDMAGMYQFCHTKRWVVEYVFIWQVCTIPNQGCRICMIWQVCTIPNHFILRKESLELRPVDKGVTKVVPPFQDLPLPQQSNSLLLALIPCKMTQQQCNRKSLGI